MEPPLPPPAPPRELHRFQPDDGTLLLTDGVLLYVFVNRQSVSVLPVEGITGIKRLGKSMVIANRFATDVHLRVDKDRREASEAFERWLLSQAT